MFSRILVSAEQIVWFNIRCCFSAGSKEKEEAEKWKVSSAISSKSLLRLKMMIVQQQHLGQLLWLVQSFVNMSTRDKKSATSGLGAAPTGQMGHFKNGVLILNSSEIQKIKGRKWHRWVGQRNSQVIFIWVKAGCGSIWGPFLSPLQTELPLMLPKYALHKH